MRVMLMLLLGVALSAQGADKLYLVRPTVYSGASDSSGAVAIDTNRFLVADDESNILRVYRSDRPGPPVKEFDVSAFLDLQTKSPEADLEAGARIGDRVYWIGSHGRNHAGSKRPNRDRFFATDLTITNGDITLTPVGKPCKTLLDCLIRDARFDRFHFAAASHSAPKSANALNIEGLSATPEGHLLIGFRNPIPDRKAILIPLLNPNEVVLGETPRFGDAIQLDLGGRGIRDIAYYSGTYIIIAGSYNEHADFCIYEWKGPGTSPKAFSVSNLNKYNPEAIIIYPQRGLSEIQILNDDGIELNEGVANKKIPLAQRTFRSFWLAPQDSQSSLR